jgi:alkylation response protein AidB-like acyl-CoA dehydrogenase
MRFDGARVDADRLLGAEGQGLAIALAALDAGRLGIAAVATGLAQAALDHAVAYAKERRTFGKAIIDHQGLGFVLADMQAAITSARASYLDAARRKDLGMSYAQEASVAKLVATDAAMKVTTSRSSASCARPRSCRSSRAPTRSSASSSAATSPRRADDHARADRE